MVMLRFQRVFGAFFMSVLSLGDFGTLNSYVTAFTTTNSKRYHSISFTRYSAVESANHVILSMKPDWFADENDNDDENSLITREMFQRDMMKDPQVKRKRNKKGGGGGETSYKPLDNRDHLPFRVQTTTPDPYTHPELKKANAKQLKKKSGGTTDLEQQLTSSRLYLQQNSNNDNNNKQNKKKNKKNNKKNDNKNKKVDTSTLLGEFKLDKSTTSGDIIILGDKEYEVQKARCQYKYAGGQRFVMVRKILEVKEVTRIIDEECIMQQYENSSSCTSTILSSSSSSSSLE